MAPAASAGLSRSPASGRSTPAATGIRSRDLGSEQRYGGRIDAGIGQVELRADENARALDRGVHAAAGGGR